MKTQNNYLQTGDYHCFYCHETIPFNQAHGHYPDELKVTPCSPACGKFYKPEKGEIKKQECDFRFSHYEFPPNQSTTNFIKYAVMVCRIHGEYIKQQIL